MHAWFKNMVMGMTADFTVDVCTSGDLLKGALINDGETTLLILGMDLH